MVPLEANARRFPFDAHRAFVTIKARPLKGFTALGRQRMIQLANPTLWMDQRVRRMYQSGVNPEGAQGVQGWRGFASESSSYLDKSRTSIAESMMASEVSHMTIQSALLSGILNFMLLLIKIPVAILQ